MSTTQPMERPAPAPRRDRRRRNEGLPLVARAIGAEVTGSVASHLVGVGIDGVRRR